MAEKKEIQVIDFKTLPVDFSGVEVTDKALATLKEKYGKVPNCSTKDGYALAKEGESLVLAEIRKGKSGIFDFLGVPRASNVSVV